MARLKTPIIATVIGEGGSGGALAIGVCDRLNMLQYSTYSVISPEGCASILWKTAEKAPDAAEAMGITAERLKGLGIVDKVIAEPLGGAHRDPAVAAASIRAELTSQLQARQARYRRPAGSPLRAPDELWRGLTAMGRARGRTGSRARPEARIRLAGRRRSLACGTRLAGGLLRRPGFHRPAAPPGTSRPAREPASLVRHPCPPWPAACCRGLACALPADLQRPRRALAGGAGSGDPGQQPGARRP